MELQPPPQKLPMSSKTKLPVFNSKKLQLFHGPSLLLSLCDAQSEQRMLATGTPGVNTQQYSQVRDLLSEWAQIPSGETFPNILQRKKQTTTSGKEN